MTFNETASVRFFSETPPTRTRSARNKPRQEFASFWMKSSDAVFATFWRESFKPTQLANKTGSPRRFELIKISIPSAFALQGALREPKVINYLKRFFPDRTEMLDKIILDSKFSFENRSIVPYMNFVRLLKFGTPLSTINSLNKQEQWNLDYQSPSARVKPRAYECVPISPQQNHKIVNATLLADHYFGIRACNCSCSSMSYS